jgi:hypothetical protein
MLYVNSVSQGLNRALLDAAMLIQIIIATKLEYLVNKLRWLDHTVQYFLSAKTKFYVGYMPLLIAVSSRQNSGFYHRRGSKVTREDVVSKNCNQQIN